MADHGHSHGGCAAAVESFEHEVNEYNIFAFIVKDKSVVLNEQIEGSGLEVFKTWDERLDKTKLVTSDVDEELLFNIAFSGHVKLTGVTLIGEEGTRHPARLRVFKDRENMSFEDAAQGKPDQEMELKQDADASVDYPLKVIKFSNVYHLTLHFPRSFGSEETRIFYIGIRGAFQHAFRDKIAIANYELKPLPEDCKTGLHETVHQQIF